MQNAVVAAALPSPGGDEGAGSALTVQGRVIQRQSMAVDAERLRYAVAVLGECADAVPPGAVVDSERAEFVRALAAGEIAATLGVSLGAGRHLLELGARVTDVMPSALTALSEGRLDIPRVRVLAETTEVLDEATATAVASELVDTLEGPVWEGPSPMAWRARVQRAVVQADQHAAARRRARALAARQVRAWSEADGIAVLQVRTDALDVVLVDEVLTDLAHARPGVDATTGELCTLDQRRADALVDVFRALRDGATPAGVPVRRVHDLGLVLHADTLLGEGPHAAATAELRGLGAPAVLDASSARELAAVQLARRTGVQVLVVDATGALAHVVSLTDPANACRSRERLEGAVREALTYPPPQATDRYRPSAAIIRHVVAEAPTCSFYGCPRRARACDLDHDDPWPRGPTSVTNIDPKCRRHHQPKTVALVRSRLSAGPGQGPRRVTWTLRSGATVVTRPEPLPGCGA